jgi:hypothetical protein
MHIYKRCIKLFARYSKTHMQDRHADITIFDMHNLPQYIDTALAHVKKTFFDTFRTDLRGMGFYLNILVSTVACPINIF